MFNLLISLAAAVVATLVFGLIFGGGDLEILYGVVPGLIAFVGTYFVLARRSLEQVQRIVGAAQELLQAQKVEPALEKLKEAYPVGRWQFLVDSQIDAQIGTINYMLKKFDEAEPFLRRSFKRNGMARAMLGTLHYQRQRLTEMRLAFEEAVTASKKDALIWNVYAWCIWKSGDPSTAISILNRALQAMPGEERTEINLRNLQNNKKMKMRVWGLAWYQFHLDQPPPPKAQQGVAMPGRPIPRR